MSISKDVKARLLENGLTEEHIRRIKDLPTRKIKYAGVVSYAKFDEENGLVFILDEKGVPTGELRSVSKDESSQGYKSSFKVDRPNSHKLPRPDAADGADVDSDKEPVPYEEMKKKVLLSSIISAVIGIVLSLAVTIPVFLLSDRNAGATADEQSFVVVQVLSDLLPGDIIDSAMLNRISVSGETFNQAALSGETLYMWSEAQNLVGMAASEFVSAGECLSYSNVTGLYEVPENPLLVLEDGNAYLDIPVNLSYKYVDSVLMGRYLDITLEVVTSKNTSERVETGDVPGLNHSSSVTEKTITDIYRLSDMVIVDMIAGDGSSLYETYFSYNQIPDGMLYDYFTKVVSELLNVDADGDPDVEQLLSPFCVSTIRVQLPKDQVKAIGKLNAENTTVKINNITDIYLGETEQQEQFVTEMRFTTQVLASVLDKAV